MQTNLACRLFLVLHPQPQFVLVTCLNILHHAGEASGMLSQILEDCICSMRTGEKCELQVDMQTLSDTSSGSIPADCNMSIHLLSFKRGKDVWKLNDQERVGIARRHKTWDRQV